jgi:hypothetical protein
MEIEKPDKKKKIVEKIAYIENYLEGSLDEVIKNIESLKEKYYKYDNLSIISMSDYDGTYKLFLTYERDETDAEFNYRVDQYKRNEDFLREQYELLKKKFMEE